MQFKFIHNEFCPVCFSRAVMDSKEYIHINGQAHEKRKFECGNYVEWSPNFQRTTTGVCPKSETGLKIDYLIKDVTNKIAKALQTTELTKPLQENLLESFSHAINKFCNYNYK